jgi:hypothetical protein
MAVPNLIGVLLLSGQALRALRRWELSPFREPGEKVVDKRCRI